MGNAPRNPDLILKTVDQSLIARGLVGQELKRDGLTEREIVGAVNLAHAAFSQQRDDAVTARQQTPWKKSSFAQIVGRT
jgi:hypothetical protein